MWLGRFIVIFVSWSLLIPTPGSSIDFFRTVAMFTLGMTFDYWNDFTRSRSAGHGVRAWFFGFNIAYSTIFLIVAISGLMNTLELAPGFLRVNVFPGTEIGFDFSRLKMILFMCGYPALAIIEKMIPRSAGVQSNSEVRA